MSARDLGSLVARAARGDPAAEAELHRLLAPGLRRHYERKLREAARATVDENTVDELAQRAWIEFFRALRAGKYDATRAAASTFLYAIAANIWLRHRREVQRSRPGAAPNEALDEFAAAEDAPPMELAHAIDAVRSIVEGADAAGGFSVAERDLLRGIGDGETERDQARRTGVSPSTAHARRMDILGRFRERLAALGVGTHETRRAAAPQSTKKE